MKNKVGLIPRFTFDRFVVGHSNELACAAAYQVAQYPGLTFNPLLFYGGTGGGKAHLLHSIGHLIRERDPEVSVLCIDGERFVRGMRNALRDETFDAFKSSFESVDALLFDDIQFLASHGYQISSLKIKCQSELFQILDQFLRTQKQIVLTCSCYPDELKGIEPNLIRSFGCGLAVSIEPPEYETKVRILERKARYLGQSMPKDVIMFIATKINSHVRELEGIQNTLFASTRYEGKELNIEFTRQVLRKKFNFDC